RGLYIGAAERPENRLGDSLCLIEAVSLVPAHLVPNVGDRGAEVVTHPWIQRNPVGLIGQLVAVDPDAEPSAELAPDLLAPAFAREPACHRQTLRRRAGRVQELKKERRPARPVSFGRELSRHGGRKPDAIRTDILL